MLLQDIQVLENSYLYDYEHPGHAHVTVVVGGVWNC
jgi:hypothetical protein